MSVPIQIPILQYYTRVIFWGCEIKDNILKVAVGYFGEYLTTNKIKLKDLNGNHILTAQIPTEYLKVNRIRRVSSELYLIIEKKRAIYY